MVPAAPVVQVSKATRAGFKKGTSTAVVSNLEHIENVRPGGGPVPVKVLGVRILQERTIPGDLAGTPLHVTKDHYLDGRIVTTSTAQSTMKEVAMATATPARSKDVLDFGRMQTAAAELMRIMQRFDGPDVEPASPEQQEILLTSYQGLLEWRRRAREQMANAEGQIDAVEARLRKFFE